MINDYTDGLVRDLHRAAGFRSDSEAKLMIDAAAEIRRLRRELDLYERRDTINHLDETNWMT